MFSKKNCRRCEFRFYTVDRQCLFSSNIINKLSSTCRSILSLCSTEKYRRTLQPLISRSIMFIGSILIFSVTLIILIILPITYNSIHIIPTTSKSANPPTTKNLHFQTSIASPGLRFGFHLKTPLFVLDTQDVGKSSNGGLLTAPRESHPSEDLSELPPLVATVLPLDFMAGQEYHYPHLPVLAVSVAIRHL